MKYSRKSKLSNYCRRPIIVDPHLRIDSESDASGPSLSNPISSSCMSISVAPCAQAALPAILRALPTNRLESPRLRRVETRSRAVIRTIGFPHGSPNAHDHFLRYRRQRTCKEPAFTACRTNYPRRTLLYLIGLSRLPRIGCPQPNCD